MPQVERLTVACELLDEALRLYFEPRANYACLHLAGAAEEIFGAYVDKHGGESAFVNHRRVGVRLSAYFSSDGTPSSEKAIGDVINFAKNNTKHGHGLVDFDPRAESQELLERALTNYYLLINVFDLPETECMRRFNTEPRSA